MWGNLCRHCYVDGPVMNHGVRHSKALPDAGTAAVLVLSFRRAARAPSGAEEEAEGICSTWSSSLYPLPWMRLLACDPIDPPGCR